MNRTADIVLRAARELVAEQGARFTIAALAQRAEVSRATVYNRFGGRAALLEALRPTAGIEAGDLPTYVERSCARWAADPALYRNLGAPVGRTDGGPRRLAETLAAADLLRPGCSLKEAEDVIAVLTSFFVFDQLHHDGRRSPAAVAEILMRLSSGILA